MTTTSTGYDEEVEIEALPSSADAQKWLSGAGENTGDFYRACTALGIVVTCDFTEGPHTHTDKEDPARRGRKPDRGDFIRYRVLRPAELRVFAGKKDGAAPQELSTQRVLVAMKGYEHSVPAFDAGEKQSLSVSFDSTGALTSISNDTTGGAAAAASDLGDFSSGLKDAFDAGSDIAAPFTPGGRAKILKDQLDEINNRAALSPAPDPNKKLETRSPRRNSRRGSRSPGSWPAARQTAQSSSWAARRSPQADPAREPAPGRRPEAGSRGPAQVPLPGLRTRFLSSRMVLCRRRFAAHMPRQERAQKARSLPQLR